MPNYIQIGFTAMRDPATGGFLPAVPLYIEATENATQAETAMIDDIGKVFAEKMRQYIDAGGIIEQGGRKKKQKKSKEGES